MTEVDLESLVSLSPRTATIIRKGLERAVGDLRDRLGGPLADYTAQDVAAMLGELWTLENVVERIARYFQ
jgi:hypothetical protein